MTNPIKTCGELQPEGAIPLSRLSLPIPGTNDIYHVALSDENIKEALPGEVLYGDGVCKAGDGSGYIFSPDAFRALEEGLNPANRSLRLPAGTNAELKGRLDRLIKNPPPSLDVQSPEAGGYITTSIELYRMEAAVIREAIGDSVQASQLRRIVNPFGGALAASADKFRYAFPTKINPTQYDAAKSMLSLLAGADKTPETEVRIQVLIKEIEELKTQHLRKSVPLVPLLIPDSFFDNPNEARQRITELEMDMPVPANSDTDLDDYILFREPLFPSDVALIRWMLKDNQDGDPIFVNYNGKIAENSDDAQAYYIRRDINWDRLISALNVLKSKYETMPVDSAVAIRIEKVAREAERLDMKVKEDDDLYQAWRTLKHLGWPFAIGGASLGVGYAFIKPILDRIRKGPPGGNPPPPSGSGKINDRRPIARQMLLPRNHPLYFDPKLIAPRDSGAVENVYPEIIIVTGGAAVLSRGAMELVSGWLIRPVVNAILAF